MLELVKVVVEISISESLFILSLRNNDSVKREVVLLLSKKASVTTGWSEFGYCLFTVQLVEEYYVHALFLQNHYEPQWNL